MSPPEEVGEKLKEIEKELSFEELAVLRTLVMNRIKKERDLVEVCMCTVCATNYIHSIVYMYTHVCCVRTN